MYQVIARAAFFSALLLCLWMALTPQPVVVPGTDKTQHMAAFATLAALAVAGWPRVSLVALWIGLAVLGGAIELIQMLAPIGRDGDWLDWIADMIAVTAVLLASAMWRVGRGDDGADDGRRPGST